MRAYHSALLVSICKWFKLTKCQEGKHSCTSFHNNWWSYIFWIQVSLLHNTVVIDDVVTDENKTHSNFLQSISFKKQVLEHHSDVFWQHKIQRELVKQRELSSSTHIHADTGKINTRGTKCYQEQGCNAFCFSTGALLRHRGMLANLCYTVFYR